MYFDVRQRYFRPNFESLPLSYDRFVLAEDGTVLTPVTAKAKCKGAACLPLDGKAVMITGCRWESLGGRTVFVEESAGWYLFWLNEARTLPLVPTDLEISRYSSGEKGYLAQNLAGSLEFRW